MVVVAVIRHWVMVVVPTMYGLEGRDLSVGGGGGFHRLWEPSRPGHFLQVFRASSLRGQQRMAGVGLQPVDGMAEVGKADMGLEQGRGGFPDLGPDILGSGSVGYFVQVRYVGDDAAHREGVG